MSYCASYIYILPPASFHTPKIYIDIYRYNSAFAHHNKTYIQNLSMISSLVNLSHLQAWSVSQIFFIGIGSSKVK